MEKEDIKMLVNALDCLAKLSRPVIFKYTSSAGIADEEMKKMFCNIQLLADKYGKEE